MKTDLWRNDTSALSEALAAGAATSETLLSHYLDRTERLNPAVNAVIHLDPAAQAAAQAADARRREGTALGPLDGVPMLLKDNLLAAGMPATWGSAMFADHVPDRDEIPVERLRRAGVVFMGKTNVPEFTIDGVTDNALFGVTGNPWAPDLTPGGSSGGSVAAVALAMTPFSVGTDGGGSVRRPASYANLVGLKTSIGRIPRGQGLPQLLLDMETIGPITRTVRDQALLLDVLAGPDRRDHRSLHFAPPDFRAQLVAPAGTLRVLAVEQIGAAPVDPKIRAGYRRFVDVLADLGHDVTRGPLPFDIAPIYDRWADIADIALGLMLRRTPVMAEKASHRYVDRARRVIPAADLLEILEAIAALRNAAAMAFRSIDVILTPTSAAMPWRTGVPFPSEIDGIPVGPRGPAVFSGWVNACGHPAISVPAPRAPGDLPIGVQIAADMGQEALLLRLARQVEQTIDWRGDWPPLTREATTV